MALEVRDVAYSYGDRVALDDVSFEITPGVLTGLLGPNGAGKTTLMRIMLGVLTPDRGEVRLRGVAVDSVARQHWGYMPQERGLYPGMQVGDQVVYFGRLHGLSRTEAIARAVTCSTSSGWRSAGTSARTSCRAVCSSGSSSPPRSSTSRR